MVLEIVSEVTSLTQSLEVPFGSVRRVVVEVSGGEHHSHHPYRPEIIGPGDENRGTGDASPAFRGRGIEPAAIGKREHETAVWPLAALAAAFGALEADAVGDFVPIGTVEVPEVSPDGHQPRGPARP